MRPISSCGGARRQAETGLACEKHAGVSPSTHINLYGFEPVTFLAAMLTAQAVVSYFLNYFTALCFLCCNVVGCNVKSDLFHESIVSYSDI